MERQPLGTDLQGAAAYLGMTPERVKYLHTLKVLTSTLPDYYLYEMLDEAAKRLADRTRARLQAGKPELTVIDHESEETPHRVPYQEQAKHVEGLRDQPCNVSSRALLRKHQGGSRTKGSQ